MFSFESIGAALIPDSDETFETLARGQLTSHGETKIPNFVDSYDPSGDADLCLGESSPVSRSTAAQGETEETTVPNLFGIPSVGYVFEPDALALRPILGTPGAAVFGSRVELGMNLRRAWVSPHQNFALAEVDASAEVVLADLATCSTGGENSFGSSDRSRPGRRKPDGHGHGLLL